MNETTYDLSPAKKTFSRIGFALCAVLGITLLLSALWFAVPEMLIGEDSWFSTSSDWMWLGMIVPLYLVAVPLGALILRKLPAQKPEDHKLRVKDFLTLIPMCVCLMYGGNLIGTGLSSILSGGTAENVLVDVAMDNNLLKVVAMVIFAPLVEEWLCRKLIIDRTRQYGEKAAVFLSAFVFGLLHQNLFQFFYAFGLGLVFAYIYIRTGRLRYPVLLHAFINFMGSVVAPWLLSNVDLAAIESLDPNASPEALMETLAPMLPGYLLLMLYSLFLMGFFVWGLGLIILKWKKLVWKEPEAQLPKGTVVKTAYLNGGMVLYVLLCVGAIVLTLI